MKRFNEDDQRAEGLRKMNNFPFARFRSCSFDADATFLINSVNDKSISVAYL